jgi:hypothetical protein
MTDERFAAYLSGRLAELFAASGIEDAVPASTTMARRGDGWIVQVESRSQGQVEIGMLDDAELDAGVAAVTADDIEAWHERETRAHAAGFEPMRALAEELVAKRRRPLEAKAEQLAARQSRAAAMRAEGRSNAYIARALGLNLRTVERYFQSSESATNRERPG